MILDRVRLEASAKLNRQRKVELGQFLTPSSVAHFMASLFPASSVETARLLDAGAGVGSLSGSFLDRWASGGFSFQRVEATAYEIDDSLRRHLARTLEGYAARLNFNLHIQRTDFIEDAINQIQFHPRQRFTHAILNPPYKKIGSHGPVDSKRHEELVHLFADVTPGLVYVTAFPNRSTMARYLPEIAWETEVWVADAPSHLIHFNGVRFLGPYMKG